MSSIPENLEPVTVDGIRRGISFPVGDEAALAAAVQEALERTDRQVVGKSLSEHVRREYDWGAIAERTEAIYRDIAVTVPLMV